MKCSPCNFFHYRSFTSFVTTSLTRDQWTLSFIRSFVHSFVHSFIHSFIPPNASLPLSLASRYTYTHLVLKINVGFVLYQNLHNFLMSAAHSPMQCCLSRLLRYTHQKQVNTTFYSLTHYGNV